MSTALAKEHTEIEVESARLVAALTKLHEATPLPDPHQIEKVDLHGTYSGPEPPDLVGTAMLARYVPDGRIFRRIREAARRHVDRAASMLGLPRVEIKWFELVDEQPADFAFVATEPDRVLGGICRSEEPLVIHLNAGIQGDALVGVIAHEVRHSQQHYIVQLLTDLRWVEKDANAFARAYAASLE